MNYFARYKFKLNFINAFVNFARFKYNFLHRNKNLLKLTTFCLTFQYGLLKATPLSFANMLEFKKEKKIPKRLRRFKQFSSIEYNGIEYMTPQDFLDSLILDMPKERVFRRVINNNQLKKMLNSTPPLRKSNHKLFQSLGSNGIISYAEYLFILTLLTKSQFAFKIAFLMFDEDENGRIDKKEFLLICALLISNYFRQNQNFDENCLIADDVEYSVLERLANQFQFSNNTNFLKDIQALVI